jgi:6-phosphogluconolactonase
MSFKIKRFYSETKWKEAIFKKLESNKDRSIVVPGGKTPVFLYKEYFSKNLRNILIPSDDRITNDIGESNYKLIRSYSKNKVIQLCEFPCSNYKDVNLEKISDSILSFQLPNIGLLGLGNDGHYASIFPSSNIIKEDSGGIVRIVYSPCSDQKYRITLTESFIENIQELLFVVRGQSKSKIINNIEENLSSVDHLPIGKLIKSYNGKLNIYFYLYD